jgi:hypothetical protein
MKTANCFLVYVIKIHDVKPSTTVDVSEYKWKAKDTWNLWLAKLQWIKNYYITFGYCLIWQVENFSVSFFESRFVEWKWYHSQYILMACGASA